MLVGLLRRFDGLTGLPATSPEVVSFCFPPVAGSRTLEDASNLIADAWQTEPLFVFGMLISMTLEVVEFEDYNISELFDSSLVVLLDYSRCGRLMATTSSGMEAMVWHSLVPERSARVKYFD